MTDSGKPSGLSDKCKNNCHERFFSTGPCWRPVLTKDVYAFGTYGSRFYHIFTIISVPVAARFKHLNLGFLVNCSTILCFHYLPSSPFCILDRQRYWKTKIDCLRFVMSPILVPVFWSFFFLLQPLTVLMKQTRQAVRTIKHLYYLDVYGRKFQMDETDHYWKYLSVPQLPSNNCKA